MSPESFKRKLTAILSADVKGYSRLMGENEAETVKTLTAYRKIMGELIQQHRGRVIDSPGDNILAEFGSVIEKAEAALQAFQERMGAMQAGRPYYSPFKDRRVEDSFFEGLLKAGAPNRSLVSLHVSKENQLTGDDLRAFFYPSTTTGFTGTVFGGSFFSQEIAKDGTVTLRPLGLGELDTGRSWLEGDTVCFQFQKAFSGMAYCSTIFRNQRGSPETKNEYIGFNDVGWTLFSRVQAQ